MAEDPGQHAQPLVESNLLEWSQELCVEAEAEADAAQAAPAAAVQDPT
jgi:hypothetical protein